MGNKDEKVPFIEGDVSKRVVEWERAQMKEQLRRMVIELETTRQAAIQAGHGDLLEEVLKEEAAKRAPQGGK